MRMRAIAVGQDCESQLAVSVAEQESRVAWDASAVRKIAISVAHLNPPGQAEPGSIISPDPFDRTFKLIALARQHLRVSRLTDNPLAFEHSSIEIGKHPICLREPADIDHTCRPYRRLEPHGSTLASCLFVYDVGNR